MINSTVAIAKEKLVQLLDSGQFAIGSKLPSERELEELITVKRMTLRQALLHLEAESRIFRKDRRGWFVALPRFQYHPKQATSFKLAALAQKWHPSWGYAEKGHCHKIPLAAEVLYRSEETKTLYEVTGWGALDSHKVFFHRSYINPLVAPDFINTLAEQSFHEHWQQQYNKTLHTQSVKITPVRVDDDISKEIGSTVGTPAILIEKYRADEQGHILQLDREYWRFESVNIIL
ncbi:GntR family transcriptional regulator [Acinetobacter calcoaceticus]|uniref:GntR family transcriptional regulator n=1 Tax=Acinetobacter calcoaceticus TaxID=471 RepID=A0A4R1XUX2_ACICA|nr:GntR family transcriptional regulator [Acinetobacter calcoaceticus]